MKRLTYAGNFCDIAMCKENPCPYDNSCSQREVWERLKFYEDLQAAGRLRILKHSYGEGCATCEHWHRIEGTRRGTCSKRAKRRNKWGQEIDAPFEPSQSRMACKDYERKETIAYAGNT